MMKINIDLENLQEIVEGVAKQSTEKGINEAITEITKKYIEENYKSKIEETVSNAVQTAIDTYLNTARITVGGGFSAEPEATYTPIQYVNKKINEYFENQAFTTKEKDRWNGNIVTKKTTFENYIENQFNIDRKIKDQLEAFGTALKRNVNNHIKDTFNDTLKSTLNTVIINSLMENKAFKETVDSIKELK